MRRDGLSKQGAIYSAFALTPPLVSFLVVRSVGLHFSTSIKLMEADQLFEIFAAEHEAWYFKLFLQ